MCIVITGAIMPAGASSIYWGTISRAQGEASDMKKKRKPSSITDIARLAGVSTATVSRVINRQQNVQPKLRDRVESAMRLVNYLPLRKAPKLKGVTVGVIVPDISNPWFPLLIKGIENTARISSYSVILCDSDNDPEIERKQISTLLDRGVNGMIVIPTSKDCNYLADLAADGYPIVFLDRNVPSSRSHYVTSDNEDGAYQATRYLLSLGHRSIAYLAGPLSINTEPIRYAGFARALEESGIDPKGQVYLQGDYSFEKARRLVAELMGSGSQVTAIFASNDFMALGAREALSELELRVPEDISLMGFDDVPFSALLSLTTISQPAFDLGKNALILLGDVMNQRIEKPTEIMLPTRIVIRGSCRKI
jgi:LacI family transcriptional regulator